METCVAKILVVDDEQGVRHMLRRAFTAFGYDVVEAESGVKGLEKAAETHPDLVLTDFKMPQMNGLEMARRLLQETPDRPVLLMTAYADLESARKAMRVGIYEYFVKPLNIDDLMAGVKRGLEYRRLLVENRAYQADLERKIAERTEALRQKVEDLEARDVLLRNLLSVQEPGAALGLAVKLALGLCECAFGALYTPRDDGGYLLRAGVGFGDREAILSPDALKDLALDREDATQEMLDAAREQNGVLVLSETDAVRQGVGICTLGILPVYKKEAVIAFLEVGRGADEDAVTEGDLSRLQEFSPYVAMAVDDCILQEEMPRWDNDVEHLLDETEKWTE